MEPAVQPIAQVVLDNILFWHENPKERKKAVRSPRILWLVKVIAQLTHRPVRFAVTSLLMGKNCRTTEKGHNQLRTLWTMPAHTDHPTHLGAGLIVHPPPAFLPSPPLYPPSFFFTSKYDPGCPTPPLAISTLTKKTSPENSKYYDSFSFKNKKKRKKEKNRKEKKTQSETETGHTPTQPKDQRLALPRQLIDLSITRSWKRSWCEWGHS